MAIINHPDKKAKESSEETPKGILPNKSAKSALKDIPTSYHAEKADITQSNAEKNGGSSKLVAVLLLIIMLIGAWTVYNGQYISIPHAQNNNIDMQIETIAKISSFITLTEEEMLNNQRTYEQAKDLGHQTVTDTMTLALTKNREELEAYKQQLAKHMHALYMSYEEDESNVTLLFKAKIKEAATTESVGRVDALGEALRILREAEKQRDASSFITQTYTTP